MATGWSLPDGDLPADDAFSVKGYTERLEKGVTRSESAMKVVLSMLKRLYSDERGAEGLEKLLIIAAIVLPLLGLLIAFRGDIGEWVTNLWQQIKGEAQTPLPTP